MSTTEKREDWLLGKLPKDQCPRLGNFCILRFVILYKVILRSLIWLVFNISFVYTLDMSLSLNTQRDSQNEEGVENLAGTSTIYHPTTYLDHNDNVMNLSPRRRPVWDISNCARNLQEAFNSVGTLKLFALLQYQ